MSDNASLVISIAVFFTFCSIVVVAHAYRDKPRRKNSKDDA